MRFLTDLVPQFKSFLNHLYEKDEENILNKKKKREEIKQKIKAEKNNRNTNKPMQSFQNMFITQMNAYPQIQNYNFLNNNYHFLNNYNYKIAQNDMMPFYNNLAYISMPSIDTNNIDSIIEKIKNKGTVSHIIGAYYIKNTQQNNNKNIDKKVVPINTVINENQFFENNIKNNNNLINNNNNEKNNFEISNNNNYISNQEKQNPKSNKEIEQKNEEKENQINNRKENEIPIQVENTSQINNPGQEKK